MNLYFESPKKHLKFLLNEDNTIIYNYFLKVFLDLFLVMVDIIFYIIS